MAKIKCQCSHRQVHLVSYTPLIFVGKYLDGVCVYNTLPTASRLRIETQLVYKWRITIDASIVDASKNDRKTSIVSQNICWSSQQLTSRRFIYYTKVLPLFLHSFIIQLFGRRYWITFKWRNEEQMNGVMISCYTENDRLFFFDWHNDKWICRHVLVAISFLKKKKYFCDSPLGRIDTSQSLFFFSWQAAGSYVALFGTKEKIPPFFFSKENSQNCTFKI